MRTPRDWDAILDALENAIGNRTAALVSGEAPATAITTAAPVDLPDDAGPVPAELRARAEAVLAALGAQEHALGAELARIEGELQRVVRSRGGVPRTAVERRRGGFEARV